MSGSVNRALTITVVTGPTVPLPPAPSGAVEKLWLGLAAEFAARGHSTTLIARGLAGEPLEEERDGVRIVRLAGFDRSAVLAVNLTRDLVYSRRALQRLPIADILVTNCFWLPVLAARRHPTGGRVVVNVNRFPKGQMGLYRSVDRLSAVSQVVAQAIVAQTPRVAGKVGVIPNAVDTRIFRPPAAPRSRQEPRTVLYTGRIHPEKGLHLLVPAFRRLAAAHSDIRLRLVGPWETARGGGGRRYLERLRSLASGLPVELPGAVADPARLAAELRAATLFCYPSLAERGEAHPVAPLEAMATGLAPVVSDLAVFNELIRSGHDGLIFDHRGDGASERLTAALGQLLDDPRRTAEMGAAAALRASELSLPRVAERYLQDFEALVTSRGPEHLARGPARSSSRGPRTDGR